MQAYTVIYQKKDVSFVFMSGHSPMLFGSSTLPYRNPLSFSFKFSLLNTQSTILDRSIKLKKSSAPLFTVFYAIEHT